LLRPDNPVRLLADLKKLGLHDGGASAASDVTNH
jgi:hypothetical protein